MTGIVDPELNSPVNFHSRKYTEPEPSRKYTEPEPSRKYTEPEHSRKYTEQEHSRKYTEPEHSRKYRNHRNTGCLTVSTDPGLPEEKQLINQFVSIKLKQFDVMVHDKCSRLHHLISKARVCD